MALLTQGAGSFSGKFGEALDSLKAAALNETVSINNIPQYANAVINGLEEWIGKIDGLSKVDTIPDSTRSKILSIKDKLTGEVDFLKSISAKPVPITLSPEEKQRLIDLPDYIKESIEYLSNALLPSNEGHVLFRVLNNLGFDNDNDGYKKEIISKTGDYELLNIAGEDYIVPWLVIKEDESITIRIEFKKKIQNYLKSGKILTITPSINFLKINGENEVVINSSNQNQFERGFTLLSKIDFADIDFGSNHFLKVLDEEGKMVGKLNLLAGIDIIKTKRAKVYYLNHGIGTAENTFTQETIKTNLNNAYKVAFAEWEIESFETINISKVYDSLYKKKNITFNDVVGFPFLVQFKSIKNTFHFKVLSYCSWTR
jgi:hypothetical protein